MSWDVEDTKREERNRQRRYELTLAERREAVTGDSRSWASSRVLDACRAPSTKTGQV